MDIDWNDAQLFLAVAETGSLSAAARKLRVAQPTVSRRLAELEERLGEAMFLRNAEGAQLTGFGEQLLQPAKHMAEWAAELERAAEKTKTALEGLVRISAPPGFAFDLCAPFAAWLQTRLPGIRLEVLATVRYVDLVRREADMAIRLERPTQRDLQSIASLELDVVAFAAQALATKLGPRPRVADIPWIGWAPPLQDTPPNTLLARMIPDFRPVFTSDDYLVQLRAAEVGLGAIILGNMRHRFARSTELIPLTVADLPSFKAGLHLVASKSALAIPRVRAVADLLAAEIMQADTRKPRAKKPSR